MYKNGLITLYLTKDITKLDKLWDMKINQRLLIVVPEATAKLCWQGQALKEKAGIFGPPF
jgi:hypothetical protein